MLAGNEPENLKKDFQDFFASNGSLPGMALWKWKNSYWICSPQKVKQKVMAKFFNYRIIEFTSAPSPADIEFIMGDRESLSGNS
jgi:hypothetical protein